MDLDSSTAIDLCAAAHSRLFLTVSTIDDESVQQPSRLPGWSVGHVITHLARNADGHERRLRAALAGREVPRYPGGPRQRAADIESGAARTSAELARDLRDSTGRLEAVWQQCVAAGWPNASFLAGDAFPTTESPVRRLREVEMHHVDLGLGYEPEDWPDEYVTWELPRALETVEGRVHGRSDAARLLAWLTGRGEAPTGLGLDPWL